MDAETLTTRIIGATWRCYGKHDLWHEVMVACQVAQYAAFYLDNSEVNENLKFLWWIAMGHTANNPTACPYHVNYESVMDQFKRHARNASFHFASEQTGEWRLGYVEQEKAMELYKTHDHRREEMREAIKGQLWASEFKRQAEEIDNE